MKLKLTAVFSAGVSRPVRGAAGVIVSNDTGASSRGRRKRSLRCATSQARLRPLQQGRSISDERSSDIWRSHRLLVCSSRAAHPVKEHARRRWITEETISTLY